MQADSGTNAKSRYRIKILSSIIMLLTTPLWLFVIAAGGYGIYVIVGMMILPLTLLESFTVLDVIIRLAIPLCALIPTSLVLIVSQIYFLILRWGSVLLTYVAVSADGVEVRLWPYHRVFCAWKDVIKKSNPYDSRWDAWRLNKVEVLPEDRWTMLIRPKSAALKFMIPDRDFNPHRYQGYPKGALANDLARYAPGLFD